MCCGHFINMMIWKGDNILQQFRDLWTMDLPLQPQNPVLRIPLSLFCSYRVSWKL
jgi:hypothetical protein